MIVGLVLLALFTGLCVCLQGVTNGALAARTSLFAAVFLNGLVVAIGTGLLWLSDRKPLISPEPTPWFLYLGGFYGISILGCAAFVFPRLGAGATTAFVVTAQLGSALALDHYGVPDRIPVTGARLVGAVLLLAGALLVLWPKIRGLVGRIRLRRAASAVYERRGGERMETHALIGPVVALVLWTLVVWLWMIATRVPAMQKAQIDPQSAARTGVLADKLPPEVMYVSDNYNHLMEQPTIFYAAALAAQIAGQADGTNVALAWTYVILRVVHSLIQCTVNVVAARFAMFALSTIALAVLTIRVALAVF